MPQPNPSYADGLQGVTELLAFCHNTLATYICYDGDPGEEAIQKEYTDSNEEPLGSVTRTGFSKGTLNLQYDQNTDELPAAAKLMRPGYIIFFRGRFYVVGAVKPKIVKNEVIKFSVAITELQNPAIPALLTVLGQQKKAAGGSFPVVAVNVRPLGVLTWAIESFADPTVTPVGASVAPGVGAAATVTVGAASDVRVIAIDTFDGTVHKGWGRITTP